MKSYHAKGSLNLLKKFPMYDVTLKLPTFTLCRLLMRIDTLRKEIKVEHHTLYISMYIHDKISNQ